MFIILDSYDFSKGNWSRTGYEPRWQFGERSHLFPPTRHFEVDFEQTFLYCMIQSILFLLSQGRSC
jgi:hypothetical protein